MVVLVVHQDRIVTFKSKGQSPVAVDPDRPVAFKVTTQRVESPAWNIHVFRQLRPIKMGKQAGQFCGVVGLNASL
jgi:hypothetical protein